MVIEYARQRIINIKTERQRFFFLTNFSRIKRKKKRYEYWVVSILTFVYVIIYLKRVHTSGQVTFMERVFYMWNINYATQD